MATRCVGKVRKKRREKPLKYHNGFASCASKLPLKNSFFTLRASGHACVWIAAALAAGCASDSSVRSYVPQIVTPFRIDIQQGNFVTREMADKLAVGQTREQVRFILGTPLLVDIFHANRWDYVFRVAKGWNAPEKRKLIVFFDAGGRVEKWDADLPPAVQVDVPAAAAPPSGASPKAADGPAPASLPESDSKAEVRPVTPAAPPAVPIAPALPAPPAEPLPALAPSLAPPPGAAASAAAPPVGPPTLGAPPSAPLALVQTASAAPQPPQAPASAAPQPPQAPVSVALPVVKVTPDELPAPPAQAQAASPAAVLAALETWRSAWSARDVASYLAMYAPDFKPGTGVSRAGWLAQRHERLVRPSFIVVKVQDPSVTLAGNDAAVAVFTQVFESDTFKETGRKTLGFANLGGKWLIREETFIK